MPPEARRCARRAVLLALSGAVAACSPGTPPTREQAGADLYNANCAACHQADAHGIPGVYPSLARSPVVLGDPAVFALWVVKGRRPESLPAGRYGTAMPQFGWMRDTDVAALLTYLRAHFGNDAAPVPPAALSRVLEE
jgi:mono/diheme cytochrome c family protein